ncbi:MAG TPA: ParB/Srx family N-terminal domain-containing protein [Haliscomenobacter sp.]|uniref:ParB/Srx family N-terminal domain-containing protein n=1 Tax=Haliscomenobacter sp. TaxID=2717303 RepID=UPI002CF093E9|nr:ParB/Srx family N-terminal domain-containing protein [Haliscomenobacter sp.]HOY17292.1 ParB/Srx family N-terminal domain-containing protein [Haliscomenobacter sp.]
MNTQNISLNELYLDPNNYRLRSHPQYKEIQDLTDEKIIGPALQQRTFAIVSGKNNFEIRDLIDSFKTNGLLKVDNILVRKLANNKGYVVIEGNRRVAALKELKKSYDEGFDIGKLSPELLNEEINLTGGIEVVNYSYSTPEDYLILMGLRHVSGNKKWDRYNQAKLIAELHMKGSTVSEIANKLGIANKRAVQEQLDAYYAIQDFINDEITYEDSPSFNPHDRFMIFVEVLLKRNVRSWLNWDSNQKKFLNTENLKRFYTWITPTFEATDEEDAGLNDGDTLEPIIVNHKDIRLLDEIVDDPDSLDRMEETRSITEAIEQNEGYTKKKFSREIKRAELILKNIKFGPSLDLETSDIYALENIKKIADRIIGVNEEG